MKAGSSLYARILVPTDGSRLSDRAVRSAIALARSLGARITALHVVAPYAPPMAFDGIMPEAAIYTAAEYRKATETRARRLLAKVEAQARAARVPCDTLFIHDAVPWKAILRTARSRRCGLIAMASHGRHGVDAVILGSETRKVLAHTKRPVLVCR